MKKSTRESKIIEEFEKNSNQTLGEIAEKFDTSKYVVSKTITEYFKKKNYGKN